MAEFFAAAAAGTEGALARELTALGMDGVRRGRGGASFFGPQEEGWRACLHSRVATRIQMVVGRFPVHSAEDLYEGVKGIDWETPLSPRHTLAVTALGTTDVLRHTGFTALRTKDAVVDRLRERFGRRPSVDTSDPDLRIVTHLGPRGATIYVDMAGESLHRRGYRGDDAGEAPVRETLAAAILAMAGYDGRRPLHDPFCGSGTLAVEAALIAWNIAPGLFRERFGFERWASHDRFAQRHTEELRQEARMAIRRDRDAVPGVYASDADPRMVALTEAAAAAAGVPLKVRCQPVADTRPLSPPGMIVTNPPWGARLERPDALAAEIGETLGGLSGHTVAILAGDPALEVALPGPHRSRFKLKSGPIDGALVVWDVG